MNLKKTFSHFYGSLKISILFIILVLAIEGSMYAYWEIIIQPRLHIEAKANAEIIAVSESHLLAQIPK